MSEQNPLFRKAALDKLASPERLDVLMQVTSAKGWAALVMMGVILSGAITWGFLGDIPSLVQAKGILIVEGGLRQLNSNGEGQVTRLHVTPGTTIEEGTVIAELSMPDIEDRIRQAQQRRDDAWREYQNSRIEDMGTSVGAAGAIRQYEAEKRRIQDEIRSKDDEIVVLRERLEKKIITKQRLDQAVQQKSSLQSQLIGLDNQIRQAQVSTTSVNQKIRARQSAAEDADRELERLRNMMSRTTQVRAPFGGRIVELRKNVGDQVRIGERLAIVEPLGSALESVVYVDIGQAKTIDKSMEVQVSPAGVERERYGFIRGEVESISDYAATPESIAELVANQAVAADLLGNRPKVEMRVKLLPNPNTPSGLQWSTLEGPPTKLGTSTPLQVEIVVERRRPVTFVLPKIKEMLGLS